MQHYLQAILTRFFVSCVFFIGALSGTLAQELYEEADIAFNRRGYFEAPSDYVAAYAKVKSDVDLKAYCAFKAGECMRLLHDPRGATEWYDKYGNSGDSSVADGRIEYADIAAIALEEPPS